MRGFSATQLDCFLSFSIPISHASCLLLAFNPRAFLETKGVGSIRMHRADKLAINGMELSGEGQKS